MFVDGMTSLSCSPVSLNKLEDVFGLRRGYIPHFCCLYCQKSLFFFVYFFYYYKTFFFSIIFEFFIFMYFCLFTTIDRWWSFQPRLICRHNRNWYFSVSCMCYVDIFGSGEFCQFRLDIKSALVIFLLILCSHKCEIFYTRFHVLEKKGEAR